MSDKKRQWYIVHTYSGFEERVAETLRQRADAMDMADSFGEIRIPTETIVELKNGKKRETQRKFFPGYILVEMEMSDAGWHVVKNTPKVTGFVGTGKKPTPLTQEDVDRIVDHVTSAKEKPKPKYVFEKGEPVKIIDGPFNNFRGRRRGQPGPRHAEGDGHNLRSADAGRAQLSPGREALGVPPAADKH